MTYLAKNPQPPAERLGAGSFGTRVCHVPACRYAISANASVAAVLRGCSPSHGRPPPGDCGRLTLGRAGLLLIGGADGRASPVSVV